MSDSHLERELIDLSAQVESLRTLVQRANKVEDTQMRITVLEQQVQRLFKLADTQYDIINKLHGYIEELVT